VSFTQRTRSAHLAPLPVFFLGLFAVAVQPGCRHSATLEAEREYELDQEVEEPLTLLDYLPAQDAPGVPRNMQPYFFFNKELVDPAQMLLDIEHPYQPEYSFTYKTDFDLAGLLYTPDATFYTDNGVDEFDMTIGEKYHDPLLTASPFCTTFPDGMLFNMSTGLVCETFGGSESQAKLMTSMFTPGVYPLWIMVVEGLTRETQLPAVLNMFVGPGYIRDNGNYRIYREVGLSTLFWDVDVAADGHFTVTLDGEFLPLDTPEGVVLTYMNDVTLSGQLNLAVDPPRIDGFHIEGIMAARSLLKLQNESETYAPMISLLELDVDQNGNGEPDSATFVASAVPTEIPLELWDP
jgi:hypothetical protein